MHREGLVGEKPGQNKTETTLGHTCAKIQVILNIEWRGNAIKVEPRFLNRP